MGLSRTLVMLLSLRARPSRSLLQSNWVALWRRGMRTGVLYRRGRQIPFGLWIERGVTAETRLSL